MELTFDTCAYLSALFHFFKSGFALYGDTRNANYRAGCRENVDNFNPTRSPHNKVRRSLKRGWLEEIGCKFWRLMLIHAEILCCAGVQVNIQTFRVEIFSIASRPLWNLALSPSGHLLSEYMHYHWLRCCVSLSDFDVSKFRDQWSWRFFRGAGARNRSYTTVNHRAFKTYPKILNSEFLSKS